MDLEKAILTAIDFETKVRAVYADAARKSKDDTGKRVLEVLANEEQTHVDFLNAKLAEWRESGKVTPQKLATVVPPGDEIKRRVKALRRKVRDPSDQSHDLDLLKRALAVESETGEFYRQMARELDADGRALFQPFVEIEEGHYAVVQAEIDALNGLGFWFDFREFDLEAG
jgi:rubrerythrin